MNATTFFSSTEPASGGSDLTPGKAMPKNSIAEWTFEGTEI